MTLDQMVFYLRVKQLNVPFIKGYNSVKKRSNAPKLELDVYLFKRKPYKKFQIPHFIHLKKVRKTGYEYQGE